MFQNYYYCLVAGLPDLLLDDSELSFSMEEFKSSLKFELKPADYKLVELIFLPYDNENLLHILREEFDALNPLGNYSYEDFETELGEDQLNILPDYMYRFIDAYRNEEGKKKSWEEHEMTLTKMFYAYILQTKNTFLQQWFSFNRDIKNLLAGFNCRKFEVEPESQLVGDNFITEAIIKSGSRDFGLETELEYLPELMSAIDKEGLLQREKAIDKMKWDKLEEITLFEYFSVDVVLAYVIKLDMVYRWMELDEETGRKMFEQLINDLKSSLEFPKEYSINGKNK